MADASEQQHDDDVAAGIHVESGGVDGAHCLNRHVSDYKENTGCSHRWQAYMHGMDDAGIYNWPIYKRLSERKSDIKTDVKKNVKITNKDTGKTRIAKYFPEFYRPFLKPPAEGEWNIGAGTNFQKSCAVPWYHNGHHMIPNSELRKGLMRIGKEIEKARPLIDGIATVRKGLAKGGYNLNHKLNMIILPMDKIIANCYFLPRHLEEVDRRNHPKYSNEVKAQLVGIMNELKADVLKQVKANQKHLKVDFELAKDKLVNLSTSIYSQIKTAAEAKKLQGKLDDMKINTPTP